MALTKTFLLIKYIAVLFLSNVILVNGNELDWWQKTIIYQVYPRSFKDSNGDGVGDLKGIEQKADYFAELGVGAVWLNPIFKSPMKDFGYDISNYTDIYEKFGTVDDLKSLKKKLNSLGIKLILDFVPNHTSDESEWFKKSVKREDPFTDFYVWRDPKGWDSEGNPIPPNNWISIFNINSAWTFNKERQQFYLHQFLDKQPDINYRCPQLRKSMEDVIKFWLDAGIDGFRIDAVPYLVEDENFLDEEYIDPEVPKNEYLNINHTYTMDQPLTFEIIRSWRKILDSYSKDKNVDTRVMLTEAYTTLSKTMEYYGTEQEPISEMPFNFQLISKISPQSNAKDVAKSIQDWFDNMPAGKWANWVIGNHDNFRVATRYGTEMVDALNMLVTLLPGTTITYNGEEIGMEDVFVRWDQTKDPQGTVLGKDKYLTMTRDACRSPFQWDDTYNAGFSSAYETWLPVNPNFWRINAKAQKEAEVSHYKIYRQLVEARKMRTIQYGDFHMHTPTNWTIIFTRSLQNETTFIVIINMGTEATEPDLTTLGINLPSQLYVYTASINCRYKLGDVLGSGARSFYLRPKAGLVLTTNDLSGNKTQPSSSSSKLASSITLSIISLIFFLINK
ncbi:maltase 2-like [Lycorma delicatula]|uniref:maltase 2-like n=1 Tax=Lycorma delicatula TaxID=130591 RepID=UPI003F5101CB